MQYLGGKHRLREWIATTALRYGSQRSVYIEPFVGGFNVPPAVAVRTVMPIECSDINPALIAMYKALQSGWLPPFVVSEDEYLAARLLPDTDPHKAFIGYGCSYSGKYFRGYARRLRPSGKYEDFCGASRNSLLKHISIIKRSSFNCVSYDQLAPNNALIYCDPPYEGTETYRATSFVSGFRGVDTFDYSIFWNWVRQYSANNTILVSSYNAPSDFICVGTYQRDISLANKANGYIATRIERLFMKGD